MRERFLSIALLMAMAVIGSWLAVMSLDHELPYHYLTGTITPNPANSPSELKMEWQISPAKRLCPGAVHRQLYDDETGMLVASYDRTPASISIELGDTSIIKNFNLPSDMPAKIRYVANVCFSCNPLQMLFPMCIRTPDVLFRVKQ